MFAEVDRGYDRARKYGAAMGHSDFGASLTIKLFGPKVDVRLDGSTEPTGADGPLKPRSKKGLWLLAILALKPNQPISRDWIANALWPDSETARETLRRTLTDVRSTLGPAAEKLEATNAALSLRIPESRIDIHRFDSLVRSDSLESLKAAIALYRGPMVEDCNEPWIILDRTIRNDMYLRTLERVASQHRDRGDFGEAVQYLRLAVAADRLRESAYRELMIAHAHNGEQSEAILTYRRLRLLLHQETRSEPSPETSTLYEQIRREARAETPAARPKPSESAHHAQKPAPNRGVTNLPRPLTALLGRERELRDVTALLRTSRLVTVTGPGGIGKTRLAVEIAAAIGGDFSNGVWFVELASIAEPGLVPAAAAAVLEVGEETDRDLTRSLAERIGDAAMLVILDNCEHVVHACATLARELVSRCPRLKILATSRRALRLTGETVSRLQPLGLPERLPSEGVSTQAPGELIGRSAALQLFVERAAAVDPAFSLSSRNLGAAVEICRRLDGLPLALELAAARMTALPVAQIARLLEHRFRLLTGGDRVARPRQQSLSALIDWSYDLLDPAEQALFARLSVFAGGWTFEAACSVCGEGLGDISSWETLEGLNGLVEGSLVQVAPDKGEMRYRMLETIREYAAEKLPGFDRDGETKRRYVQWFLSLAEEARVGDVGAGQAQAVVTIERDYDNLRQALQQAAPGLERLRLAIALYHYWNIRGLYSEGRSWLERALEEAPDAPFALRSRALRGAGNMSWLQGDLVAARRLHLQNLDVQRLNDDHLGIGHTLNNLGLIAFHEGDCRGAADLYRESITVLKGQGGDSGLAPVIGNLGIALKNLGDYDEAARVLHEAEALARAAGDLRALAQALQMLATLATRLQEYEKAREFISEALTANRTLGAAQGIAAAAHNLGEIASAQGDYETAVTCFHEALASFREFGEKRSIAAVLGSLGDAEYARGRFAESLECQMQSLTIELELGNRSGIGDSLLSIALLENRQGHRDRAVRLMAAARADAERLGLALSASRLGEIEGVVDEARAAMGASSVEALWETGKSGDLIETGRRWLAETRQENEAQR